MKLVCFNFNFNSTLAQTPGVTPWSGGGGNPELRPWRANAIDLSVEKYIGGKGYVALAGFYKDLETYIYDQTVRYDFTTLLENTPEELFPPGVTPQTEGDFTRPVNGSGGYVQGLELSASVPFNMFSDALQDALDPRKVASE